MPRKLKNKEESLIKLHSDIINLLTDRGLAEVCGAVFPTTKHNTKAKLREKLAKRKQQKKTN